MTPFCLTSTIMSKQKFTIKDYVFHMRCPAVDTDHSNCGGLLSFRLLSAIRKPGLSAGSNEDGKSALTQAMYN